MRKMYQYAVMAVMALLPLLSGCGDKGDDTADGDARRERLLFEHIRSSNRMVFATMSISKTGVLDDDVKWKIGDRIGVYSYNTYMTAYIDLDKLQRGDVTFDEGAKTARIVLPPIETKLDGRDFEFREEHYRVTKLRSQISAAERAGLKERMNTQLKTEVERNPEFKRRLRESAEQKARQYFRTLFAENGYDADVVFR